MSKYTINLTVGKRRSRFEPVLMYNTFQGPISTWYRMNPSYRNIGFISLNNLKKSCELTDQPECLILYKLIYGKEYINE